MSAIVFMAAPVAEINRLGKSQSEAFRDESLARKNQDWQEKACVSFLTHGGP